MKASLELRAVGTEDLAAAPETVRMGQRGRAMRRAQAIKAKAWVAELIPNLDAVSRQFVRGKLDRTRIGGAYVLYVLESGRIYEVSSPTRPFATERYYCRVTDDGDIIRITREEVDQWLLSRSGDNHSG